MDSTDMRNTEENRKVLRYIAGHKSMPHLHCTRTVRFGAGVGQSAAHGAIQRLLERDIAELISGTEDMPVVKIADHGRLKILLADLQERASVPPRPVISRAPLASVNDADLLAEVARRYPKAVGLSH